jgi:spore germination cell wall hydrolase CwlJ-like protein
MLKRRNRPTWISHTRQPAAGFALLLCAASCVPAGTQNGLGSAARENLAVSLTAAPPAPVPLVLQPVAPEAAVAMNASIPVADLANPAARAFNLRTRSMVDRMRSIDCLTAAVYYEAASESDDGQRAVAQVVLNRVRHPTYPNSVCGVVYQGSERTTGCQFSFTCDGSLLRTPAIGGWARARRVAAEALAGRVFEPVGHSTHYHANYVLPYWASSLVKSAVVGAHIFYRWNGGWGQPAAFRQTYAGVEPLPGPKPRQAMALTLPNAALLQAELASIAAVNPGQYQHVPLTVAAQAVRSDDTLPKVVFKGPGLPESQVLEAYRNSGVPKDELPASAAESGR